MAVISLLAFYRTLSVIRYAIWMQLFLLQEAASNHPICLKVYLNI